MKRISSTLALSAAVLFCPGSGLFADVVENFDGGWIDASYAGISSYEHAGVGNWESHDAVVSPERSRSGECVRLNDSTQAYLEFKGGDGDGLDGGVTAVSFWHRLWSGSDPVPFVLESNQGGAGWTEVAAGSCDSTAYAEFSAAIELSGNDIRLRIRPSAAVERMLIDDFAVASGPTLPDSATVDFGESRSSASETAGTVRIPVVLTQAADCRVEVAVTGGSAVSPEDFELLTPVLDFSAGATMAMAEVTIIDDGRVEGSEVVELKLSSPSGVKVGQAGHVLSILDDDRSNPAGGGEKLVIMSANTTSGNFQQYEGPGDRIFEAIRPDIVGIQEFTVPEDGGIRAWVDRVFGEEFDYMIEAGDENIPCGVISRYPITASGEWEDPQVGDRDFAWASIDIPGDTDLHVISVHLHGSGGSSSRNAEAEVIIEQVRATFPASDYVVLCGDFNTTTRTEPAVETLKQIFSDAHVPVDQDGDGDTNMNRNKPYDWVMPNAPLDALHTSFSIGGLDFPDGFVLDTRKWPNPPSPTLSSDSGATNMQHMAVVKCYQLPSDAAEVTARGTPHRWLEGYGITGDLDAEEALDPDGDGFATWQEYHSNTDPLDGNSKFAITDFSVEDDRVLVVCSTSPGRRYSIDFADPPANGTDDLKWLPFGSPTVGIHEETRALETTHTFVDDFSESTTMRRPPEGCRLYRVSVEIP